MKRRGGSEAIPAGRFLRIRTRWLTSSPMTMQISPKGLGIDADAKQGSELPWNNVGISKGNRSRIWERAMHFEEGAQLICKQRH